MPILQMKRVQALTQFAQDYTHTKELEPTFRPGTAWLKSLFEEYRYGHGPRINIERKEFTFTNPFSEESPVE